MTGASVDGAAFGPRRVDKPWGHEIIWAENDLYVGKILHVEEGCQLSYQYHVEKDETMHVLRGRVELDVAFGDEEPTPVRLVAGQSFRIRPGCRHRLRALETSDILEASTPHLDDVVRIADDYGRVARSDP